MIVRRAFLAGVGGLAALAPSIATGAGAPVEIALPASYATNLPERLPRSVAAGMPLRLVREPERPYDAASVAVLSGDGERIGYLPTIQSRMLAPLLDAGLSARGEVVAAGTSPRPFVRLNLFLEVTGPA